MISDAIATSACGWWRTELLGMLQSGRFETWTGTGTVGGDYHDWQWLPYGHGDHIHLDTRLFAYPAQLATVIWHEFGHRNHANDGSSTMQGFEQNTPCEVM